jgi:hypothetical protein
VFEQDKGKENPRKTKFNPPVHYFALFIVNEQAVLLSKPY